uniref:Uncharacterized protein n=1 Tax=Mus musculus TaxID=10090 RepID=Q9DCH0_MOUSE|nr:unnamed protein product [Mus musculus]
MTAAVRAGAGRAGLPGGGSERLAGLSARRAQHGHVQPSPATLESTRRSSPIPAAPGSSRGRRPAPPRLWGARPAPPPPARPCSPARRVRLSSSLPFPERLFLLFPTRSRPSSSFRGSGDGERSLCPPPPDACTSPISAHKVQVTQAGPRSGRLTERDGGFVIAGLGPRDQTT